MVFWLLCHSTRQKRNACLTPRHDAHLLYRLTISSCGHSLFFFLFLFFVFLFLLSYPLIHVPHTRDSFDNCMDPSPHNGAFVVLGHSPWTAGQKDVWALATFKRIWMRSDGSGSLFAGIFILDQRRLPGITFEIASSRRSTATSPLFA